MCDGTKIATFLNAQNVYFLAGGSGNLRLCGLSSFDGTCIYVVDEEDGSIIPHELDQNIIRRYIKEDPTLRRTNSEGVSLQCGAGFVMEQKNGRKAPYDLIEPFSAPWNRRILKYRGRTSVSGSLLDILLVAFYPKQIQLDGRFI